MKRRKHLAKLLSLCFILGVLMITLEVHADHECGDCQEAQHCSIQCCATHNLAPTQDNLKSSNLATKASFVPTYTVNRPLNTIPSGIFRPPIVSA